MASADSSDEWRPGADGPDSDLSDLEIAAPPPRRFSTFGQDSMNSMVATAAEDRALTKRNQKERTFKSLVPGTDRLYLLWSNGFDWFRVNTLKQNLTDTPNDYQLERFIDGIVRHIGRRTATGTASTIAQLINDGLATNAQIREPLWITSDLIRRMNTAIIKDAMEEGTMSWDCIILSVVILSLQSALSARAGEIGRSRDYKGEEYLAYKDIDIRWVDTNDGKGKLSCVITLRAEKGKK
ncbi:hypothetical protein C8A01DRAFT_41158 [Parachaetomium inaequale]|uniref:Uncharacterized protein n=1 Tax=Parachaetomium inaequale TaxID=2588326 RepID=A0AAN6SL41_9PEZI|nr:hypothetical protein C8A01DRAFT_41158 [Parachaetomium inaequale]